MTVSATVRTINCAMGPLLFGTMVLRRSTIQARRSTIQAWRPIWQDSDRAYLESVGTFQLTLTYVGLRSQLDWSDHNVRRFPGSRATAPGASPLWHSM
jgi:hypothetical protein